MNEQVLTIILEAIKNGKWELVITTILIVLIYRLPTIVNSYESNASKREKYAKEAIKIESLSKTVHGFLEEEINYLVFKRLTGIKAHAELRSKIKEITQRANNQLTIDLLSRAWRYVKYNEENKKLSVRITISDKIVLFLQTFLVIYILGIYLLLLSLDDRIALLPAPELSGLIASCFVLLEGLIILIWDFMAFPIARDLKPIIEKLEAEVPYPIPIEILPVLKNEIEGDAVTIVEKAEVMVNQPAFQG